MKLIALLLILPTCAVAAAPKGVEIPASSSNLDSVFSKHADNDITFRLEPGVYTTVGIRLRAGWKIRGSGMDATIIVLSDRGTPGSSDPVIGYGHVPTQTDGAEVSDLTVDCNQQNQAGNTALGAVTLWGSHTRVSRVKVINWGSRRGEGYTITLRGSSRFGQAVTNCIIEDCVVTAPFPANYNKNGRYHSTDGGSIMNGPSIIGDTPLEQKTPGNGWVKGAEIRDCFVGDVALSTDGTGPRNFRAMTMGGTIGGRIHDNLVQNLGAVDSKGNSEVQGAAWNWGTYEEGLHSIDTVIENNRFIGVSRGIALNPDPNYAHDYHVIRNNHIVLNNHNGIGISYTGTRARRAKNITIVNNTIHKHLEDTSGYAAVGIVVRHVDNLVCENNLVDINGISPTYSLSAALDHNENVTIARYSNNYDRSGRPVKLFQPPSRGGGPSRVR